MFSRTFFGRYFGWIITVFLCLIPVYFWLQIYSVSSIVQGNFASISLAIGQVAGLVGLVMYALNLIYSTRLRFLETMFGGLNKVFVAHHILGGLALIFLCFHPLFLALSRASYSMREGALLLLPNGLGPIESLFDYTSISHFGVVQQWAIFLGILAFWGLVVLLFITFFVKLPYSLWLVIHRFLGVAFLFALAHVVLISSDTSVSKSLKLYLVSISILGILAFIYRSLLPDVFVRRYSYKISKTKVIGDKITQISMLPMSRQLDFKAGQFIFIRFLHGNQNLKKEWHPFSISSSPDDSELQISAKALGDFTSSLPKIPTGTYVEIEGAYGKFSYTNFKNLNQIWIAGGIGITPFLSMAEKLPSDDYKVDLYYSVRTRAELIGLEQLSKIMKIKKSNLKIYPLITDSEDKILDVNLIKKHSGNLTKKEIFICGPPSMMRSLRDQLKAHGLSNKQIHTEEFRID